MGEAKRRGTYEERKAAGIVKRSAAEAIRRERLAAIEAAKTPEEKADRIRTMRLLAAMIAMRGW